MMLQYTYFYFNSTNSIWRKLPGYKSNDNHMAGCYYLVLFFKCKISLSYWDKIGDPTCTEPLCCFPAENKTPRACWAVWLSLIVHGGYSRNRPKGGHISSKPCILRHFYGHLYQITIQRALEELCLQYNIIH